MNYRLSLLLGKNSASLCSCNAALWSFWPTLSLSMHILLSLHCEYFSPTPILAMMASFLRRVGGKEQFPHSWAVISKCLEITVGQNQSVSIWQFSHMLFKETRKKRSLASMFSLPVSQFLFLPLFNFCSCYCTLSFFKISVVLSFHFTLHILISVSLLLSCHFSYFFCSFHLWFLSS